jgi:outer membrane protein assembly factor BamA
VDGGLTNNVPSDVAVEMGATFIVAVDVTSKITTISQNVDPLSYFNQAMNTLAYYTDTRNLYLSDILINPNIDEYASSDFNAIDSLIQRGYDATLPFLDELRPLADPLNWDPNYMRNAINLLNNTRIHSIQFAGNNKTRPYIIKRELLLKEGQLWNSAYAKRSMKNLFSTGLFQSIYMSFDNHSSDSVNLTVEVEEEEKTLFSFGTRYDSEKKANAFITAKYRNLFGAGIDNQLSLIVSDQYRKLEWSARTTRIFTTTFTGYSSLYQKFESVPLYEKGKRVSFGEFYHTGFEVNAGVQIRRVGLSGIGVKFVHNKILENSGHSSYPINKDQYGVGSLMFRILVENTDDPDIPKKGRKNNVIYEHSISEDDLKQFDRISVESVVYETYSDKHTFSTHIHFGYLTKVLSHYERFRLGGVNSLSGLHQDELWGSLILALGIGYRTPLTKGSFIRFQAMTGNVWNGFDDFNWQQMEIGARVGILIPTPLGPISMDYGYKFWNRGLFYLSIGHFF